jgi:dipeptidyl aminopeptidase/acylaminoacyl peptidase
VDTWKSPVLFIHGDDDRNVYFTQTVDLVARLRARGVMIEQLIFPDEVHDFLLHRSWLAGYRAASDFFDRRLKTRTDATGGNAKTKAQ